MSDETLTNPADELRAERTKPEAVLQSGDLQDPVNTPIGQIDVSDSRLYQLDAWRPYFERLRREDPVHYTAESPFGAYWSITRFKDIMEVESRHDVFSSFPTIAIGDSPNGQYIENFISMDPPKHDQQRRTLTGAVAPRNLMLLGAPDTCACQRDSRQPPRRRGRIRLGRQCLS